MKKAACIIALCAWMGGAFSSAQERTPVVDFQKTEDVEARRLDVRFRLNEPIVVQDVTAAAADGAELPAQFTAFGSNEADRSALLFLIDTSDPKRKAAIEASKALTARLIDLADPATLCAVFTFDANLGLVVNFDVPRAEIAPLLKRVKAAGMATELYRNAIEAIALLEPMPVQHRALMILSDGKAEDTTFTVEQVVGAARKAGVVINAAGYAETPGATVHLQSLRRLAAETGGLFAEADRKKRQVPDEFVELIDPLLRSGGQVAIDLSGMKEGRQISVTIQLEGRAPIVQQVALDKLALEPKPMPPPAPVMQDNKKVEEVAGQVQDVAKQVAEMAKQVAAVPMKVEEVAKKTEEARKAEEAKAAEKAAKEAEEKAKAEAERVKKIELAKAEVMAADEQRAKLAEHSARRKKALWLGVGAAIAVLGLAALFALQQRRQVLAAAAQDAPVFARLQVLDGDGTEHLMRTTALRLGRGKDNDLTLRNDSVSRHHAEISRTREGAFTITELNAGNGVLLNGEPVEKATLNHEDISDLGEVRIRFLIA